MMTQDILNTKEELRNLIDAYAYLGDEWKISEVMRLFTEDAVYRIYMGDLLVANVNGTAELEKEFNGHAAQVKAYFTMNGQHTVQLGDGTATGISFSQIKMIREPEGKRNITDYSVKYEDKYVRQNGKWLINERIGYFVMVEERALA
jgi:hypothetical protein